MKSRKKFLSLLLLTVLIASVLLLKGCGDDPLGSKDDAKDAGCPDGTVFATGTDLFQQRTSDINAYSFTLLSTSGSATELVSVGPPAFPPVTFAVTDQFAVPKNDVCVIVYSPGIIYSDATYATPISDLTGKAILKTDALGAVTIYFSTNPILVSQPATSGADGDTVDHFFFMNVYSGAIWERFEASYAVSGCAAATFGLGTCP